MRAERQCAGVAFATFARPRQSADCIAELQAHSHTAGARARRYVKQGRHLAETVMESMESGQTVGKICMCALPCRPRVLSWRERM